VPALRGSLAGSRRSAPCPIGTQAIEQRTRPTARTQPKIRRLSAKVCFQLRSGRSPSTGLLSAGDPNRTLRDCGRFDRSRPRPAADEKGLSGRFGRYAVPDRGGNDPGERPESGRRAGMLWRRLHANCHPSESITCHAGPDPYHPAISASGWSAVGCKADQRKRQLSVKPAALASTASRRATPLLRPAAIETLRIGLQRLPARRGTRRPVPPPGHHAVVGSTAVATPWCLRRDW